MSNPKNVRVTDVMKREFDLVLRGLMELIQEV